MAKIKPTTVRFPDDLKALIIEAASKCGFIRGDREQGYTAFIRQACVAKVNRVLGKRPTLPVHVPIKDKH